MKQDTKHVSELDQFLAEFDQANPEKSASQQKEIEKFARIDQLRDDPKANRQEDDKNNKDLWDGF